MSSSVHMLICWTINYWASLLGPMNFWGYWAMVAGLKCHLLSHFFPDNLMLTSLLSYKNSTLSPLPLLPIRMLDFSVYVFIQVSAPCIKILLGPLWHIALKNFHLEAKRDYFPHLSRLTLSVLSQEANSLSCWAYIHACPRVEGFLLAYQDAPWDTEKLVQMFIITCGEKLYHLVHLCFQLNVLFSNCLLCLILDNRT